MNSYKVAIIGGGPGGYVTAIRLNQFGIDTAVFEKERLGGVCLNHGCIPTKSLVKVADLNHEINIAESFGLKVENNSVDYPKVWKRKTEVVEKLVSGVEFIFKKREIPNIHKNVTKIEKKDNKFIIHTIDEIYNAEKLILATGSEPHELPFIKFDHKKIISSRDLLKIQELPESMVIVGAGVVACEFATIYKQLGVDVKMVVRSKVMRKEDKDISKKLTSALKRAKIKIFGKKNIESYEIVDGKVKLTLTKGKEVTTDLVLVSTGRDAVCDIEFVGFNPEREKGFIKIDKEMRTNCENVFSIGDVTGKSMLAHTASKQGLIVADIISNEVKGTDFEILDLDYKKIPGCTFSNPEIGTIGYTQSEAEEKFGEILIGKFQFTANGNALGKGNTFGFVKVIADKKEHKIRGIHIIGLQATELIAQAGILLGLDATIEDVKKVVFAHPTLSECVMEAIEDLENLSIHKL